MKLIFELDKDFIESIKFLEKMEKLKIDGDRVVIESDNVAKLRANSNIIFRMLKIYDNFRRFLSSL